MILTVCFSRAFLRGIQIILCFHTFNGIAQDSISYRINRYKEINCKQKEIIHVLHQDSVEWWTDTLCSKIILEELICYPEENKNCALINKQINAMYCSDVTSGKNCVKKQLDYVRKLSRKQYIDSEWNVSVAYNKSGVFSITVCNYSYEGGAHPNGFCTFKSFNLKTVEPIRLAHLFESEQLITLNRIAEQILYSTYQEAQEVWNFPEGEFQLNENFILCEKGLLFLFNPYEIGPYFIGSPEIEIPFSVFEHLLKPAARQRFNLW